ncbi:MAG: alpha-amylase [Bacteroidales bacterium]|nr:alpha-amylase [Bacteroidales bacterium]
MIIYQLLLRAFGNRSCVPGGSYSENGSGKFDDITPEFLLKLKKLSVGAVWYTGVISHATRTHFRAVPDCDPSLVKGNAGSPYAIRNWFDVDPALARNPDNRMAEFERMVERTHKAGMKVFIDFVPNHVYREYRSYFTDDNFYLLDGPLHLPGELHSAYVEDPALATGNDVFHAWPSKNDWYDTVKLNYGNRGTWSKMLQVLKFWVEKGVDGFRCDMVELVPSEFFAWAFDTLRAKHPGLVFIAEVYGKENYRKYASAGFDLLYDKSGFYDALRGIVAGSRPASCLTQEWQFLGDLQPRMLNFLENHDEQRLASDFFAGSGKAGLAALAVSLLFNQASFMLYFGQEFGERGMEAEGFSGVDGRTSIFDYCCVPSVQRFLAGKLTVEEGILYKEYCRLMRIASGDAIFSKGGTYDLMYVNPASDRFDPSRQFAWMRGHAGSAMAIVANFAAHPVDVDVFIPCEAFRYFGMECDAQPATSRDGRPGHTVRFHVGPRDYTRIDVSRL